MKTLHNLELEKSVIAALLLEDNNSLKMQWLYMLNETMFFESKHRKYYNFISSHFNRTNFIDQIVFCSEFENESDYILQMTQGLATTANTHFYIQKLLDLSKKRTVIKKIEDFKKDVIQSENPSTVISDFSLTLNHINSRNKNEQVSTEKLIKELRDLIENEKESENSNLKVPCYISFVDCNIVILIRQLHVLAGLPGAGKTAFALCCMLGQIKNNVPVIYFCGESSAREIMIRMVSILSNVEFMDIIQGLKKNTNDERQSVNEAISFLNDKQNFFRIYGKGDYDHSIEAIDFILNTISNDFPRMIYVDHIQNLKPPTHLKRESKVIQTESNARFLNDIAGKFDIAVTALSQLNREARQSNNKPSIANLKGSSGIEEEADIVTFLYEKKDENTASGEKIITWYGGKARYQERFYLNLKFRCRNTEFLGFYSRF